MGRARPDRQSGAVGVNRAFGHRKSVPVRDDPAWRSSTDSGNPHRKAPVRSNSVSAEDIRPDPAPVRGRGCGTPLPQTQRNPAPSQQGAGFRSCRLESRSLLVLVEGLVPVGPAVAVLETTLSARDLNRVATMGTARTARGVVCAHPDTSVRHVVGTLRRHRPRRSVEKLSREGYSLGELRRQGYRSIRGRPARCPTVAASIRFTSNFSMISLVPLRVSQPGLAPGDRDGPSQSAVDKTPASGQSPGWPS